MEDREGLYIISVAARLLEMHQQTLRKYERAGFIRPKRTVGNLRLYSVEDVEQLRQIKHLVEHLGMNLSGVDAILRLTQRLEALDRSLGPNLSEEETARLRNDIQEMLVLLGRSPRRDEAETVASDGPSGASQSLGGSRGAPRGV